MYSEEGLYLNIVDEVQGSSATPCLDPSVLLATSVDDECI
jgi:hypothetical protein